MIDRIIVASVVLLVIYVLCTSIKLVIAHERPDTRLVRLELVQFAVVMMICMALFGVILELENTWALIETGCPEYIKIEAYIPK